MVILAIADNTFWGFFIKNLKYMEEDFTEIDILKIRRENSMAAKTKCSDAADFIFANFEHLVYCEDWDCFFMYKDRYYKRMTQKQLKRKLYQILRNDANIDWDMSDNFATNLISTMKMAIADERIVSESDLAFNHTSFTNGLYNSKTGKLEKHTPKVYCFVYVDYDYVEEEATEESAPFYYNYLKSTFGVLNAETDVIVPDKDLIMLTEELLGALFYRSHKTLSRAVFYVGNSDNGKSVLTDLISHILPDEYISAASLETLTTDTFGKSDLLGKICNICSEDESKRLDSASFKNLVTGEGIRARFLYQDSFTFRNFAKMFFISNDAPTFPNMGWEIEKRLVVIPFNGNFKMGSKNRIERLGEALELESKYIISSWLRALRRLVANNYQYTESRLAKAEYEKLRETSNNAEIFLASDWVDFIDEPTEDINTIYVHFTKFCEDSGLKGGMGKQKFAKSINRNPKVKRSKGVAKYNIRRLSEDDRYTVNQIKEHEMESADDVFK